MSELERQFAALKEQFFARLGQAQTEQELRKTFADFGGPAGAIRLLQKQLLKDAPPTEKKSVGQLSNQTMAEIEAAFAGRLAGLEAARLEAELATRIDVTLPGRERSIGGLHLLTQVRLEMEQIFRELGFSVAHGPEIETDFHNFQALAMPENHPARDMQDTFYIEDDGQGRILDQPAGGQLLLRTHTSPIQIRTMLGQKPPVRIIAPGPVYRKDDDATHSPMFHQIEGLCVDSDISFAHLKGVLLHFIQRFFGADATLRLRPSFFPFTEPSVEVDMSCVFCGGQGCRTCKGTGWIEIGGAGMIDPEVFRQVGYDAELYSGFAFGMGLERMAILRHRVPDIRLFFSGDVQFARQFR